MPIHIQSNHAPVLVRRLDGSLAIAAGTIISPPAKDGWLDVPANTKLSDIVWCQTNKPQPLASATRVIGSKGNVYTIRTIGKRKICDCPGFKFRHSCKHIK